MVKHDDGKWLPLVATLGLAHWFFGNLYEAVVFSPNWVVDSAEQLRRLHEFFVRTSPTHYFVPLTWAAIVLVWVLAARNHDRELAGDYRRASVFAGLAMGLNLVIVATVITRIFGADYLAHGDELRGYCWRWNVLNALRMALVATTAAYTFNVFRRLDRR